MILHEDRTLVFFKHYSFKVSYCNYCQFISLQTELTKKRDKSRAAQ